MLRLVVYTVQRYSVNMILTFQEIEVWYMMSLLNANAADTLPAYQVGQREREREVSVCSVVSQTREFMKNASHHARSDTDTDTDTDRETKTQSMPAP